MAWTFIQRLSSPTSDKLEFTGLSLSGYQRVVLLLDGLVVGTDNAQILLQLYTATTLRTSGYRHYLAEASSGGTTDTSNSTSTSSVPLAGTGAANFGVGNGASKSFSGRVDICNSNLALYKLIEHNGNAIGPTGNMFRTRGGGILEQTGNIDGIKVFPSSGTLTAGSAALYGLATS